MEYLALGPSRVICHFSSNNSRRLLQLRCFPQQHSLLPKKKTTMSGIPNPLSLLSGNKAELPKVDQLGTIDLKTLNQFHCDNPDRRIISLFGKLYDVTAAEQSYGSDGAYKGETRNLFVWNIKCQPPSHKL
jgi:hypothetical protein